MIHKINVEPEEIDSFYGAGGIEIVVDGYETCPQNSKAQIHIGIFNDELHILIWDGSSSDPKVVTVPKKKRISDRKKHIRTGGKHHA